MGLKQLNEQLLTNHDLNKKLRVIGSHVCYPASLHLSCGVREGHWVEKSGFTLVPLLVSPQPLVLPWSVIVAIELSSTYHSGGELINATSCNRCSIASYCCGFATGCHHCFATQLHDTSYCRLSPLLCHSRWH